MGTYNLFTIYRLSKLANNYALRHLVVKIQKPESYNIFSLLSLLVIILSLHSSTLFSEASTFHVLFDLT